jgi:hypothetical protein
MDLTQFQENLIEELKQEFIKLNPKPVSESPGRFSIQVVKQDIDDTQAFKDSIFEHNRAIAQQLQISFVEQLDKFNTEFSPVSLNLLNDKYLFEMFSNDYSIKNPHTRDLALYFSGETDVNNWNFHVLYDYESVEIETSCQIIRCNKIKGLLWCWRGWLYRKDTVDFYATLDDYVQADKGLQRNITTRYAKLTK